MEKLRFLLSLVALTTLFIFYDLSYGVPSFARQTGFSCSTCHTIPPRLNKFGTLYKISGYTSGVNIKQIDIGDGKTLNNFNPIAIRVISLLSEKKSYKDEAETLKVENVLIYFAGKVSDDVGAFIVPNLEASGDHGYEAGVHVARLAFVKDTGANVFGIVGGITSPAGVDPFNTLDPMRTEMFPVQAPMPYFMSMDANGDGQAEQMDMGSMMLFPSLYGHDQKGISAYALIKSMVYVNAGIYTGGGGTVMENMKAEELAGGDFDFYGRIAFMPNLKVADVNVGIFGYSGRDKIHDSGENKNVSSYGIDIGVQAPITSSLMAELLANYTTGKIGEDEASGYQLWGTLYFKRMIALTLGYGASDSTLMNMNAMGSNPEMRMGGKQSGITAHISYAFRPNVRFGVEYSSVNTEFSGTDYENINSTALLLDLDF